MENEQISEFLNGRIAAGDFPSAVYLAAEKGEVKFQDALGAAVKTPDVNIAAKPDTIYDLASLTKVLITGLLFAKLIERGEINFTDSVGAHFRGFQTAEKRHVAVRDLLAHTSGFAAWKPFYILLQSQAQTGKLENPKALALGAIELEDLQTPVRTTVTYSDFNFLLLGFLLEKLYAKPLDEIARAEIFEPLDLTRTFFNPTAQPGEIAASEFGNFYEKELCREMNYNIDQVAWREKLIWGEVHDANCHALGGATGHAGLFSCATEVFKIAQQFLPATTRLLKSETCNLFKTNFTKNLNQARSFAFELAANDDSTASKSLAANSFGHLGFTGTSLWIEPDRERIFILLTNRTHRALPFVNINSARRQFHELAAAALD